MQHITATTCLKKLEMVIVTGRNESSAVLMSSAFQLSRLSGVLLFGRSTDDLRKLSYGENVEPAAERIRSKQQQHYQPRTSPQHYVSFSWGFCLPTTLTFDLLSWKLAHQLLLRWGMFTAIFICSTPFCFQAKSMYKRTRQTDTQIPAHLW